MVKKQSINEFENSADKRSDTGLVRFSRFVMAY